MILGITSLGEGRTRLSTRIQLAALHAAGGIIGGTAMVIALIVASTPIRTLVAHDPKIAVVAGLLVVLVLIDLRVVDKRSRRGQVPATWARRHGRGKAFVLYGVQLGAGLVTYVPYGVTYGVFAVAAVLLPVPQALLVGALFGLGRTLSVGLASLAPVEPLSRLLYRSRFAPKAWPYASAVLLLVLVVEFAHSGLS